MTAPPPLPALDLWITHLDECLTPARLAAYSRLLPQAETERAMRFHFQRDRDRHVVTRALLRTVLASIVGERPERLQFATGPHGKPFLQHDRDIGRRLSFSLSHTDDLVMLGVTRDHALGIDVENTNRLAPLDVVPRHFAEVEVKAFEAQTQAQHQTDLFWSCWTLKESLIKATGEGLHTPLNRFGFTFDVHDRVTLHASPGTAEGAGHWWAGQWAPTEHHLAALCVAWPADTSLASAQAPAVRARRIVPLQGETDLSIQFLRSTTGRYAA